MFAQLAHAQQFGYSARLAPEDMDTTADFSQFHYRMVELLRKYVKPYSPAMPLSSDTHVIDFSIGPDSWRGSYGQYIDFNKYSIELFLFFGQVERSLDNYELLVQSRELGNEGLERTTYSDLHYTLTSAGIGGAMYYITDPIPNFSVGLEVELMSVSRLNVFSPIANKTIEIDGAAFFSVPVWHHATFTPIKVRYAPLEHLYLLFNVQYVMYEIEQERIKAFRANPTLEGDWLVGCDADICSESDVVMSLGMQLHY